jgi:ankyrin repeat protein
VQACVDGEVEKVKSILVETPHLNQEADEGFHRTGLMEACQHGHPEVVTLLLLAKSGSADVNAIDAEGDTPLLCACDNGNAEVVLQLLNAGALCDTTNDLGQTPAITAARTAHPRALHHLIHTGTAHVAIADSAHGMPPLIWAASLGYTNVVDVLLSAGADHSPADNYSYTPVIYASMNGHVKVYSAARSPLSFSLFALN